MVMNINRDKKILNKDNMKSRSQQIIETYIVTEEATFSVDSIISAFSDEIEKCDLTGIKVVDVNIDDESVTVHFSDSSDDEMSIMFYLDGKKPMAMISDENDTIATTSLEILNPPVIISDDKSYIDLVNLSWMNKNLLSTFLKLGDLVDDDELEDSDDGKFFHLDAFGHILNKR